MEREIKSKIGRYRFKSVSYLADFRGRMTWPMLGNCLLDAATRHAADRGFGYMDMQEHHTAWVLSRLAIELYEYPGMDDEFIINTWVEDVNKLFTTRCFEIMLENGKVLGYARSIWAAIDIKTRRPTMLDRASLEEYLCDKDCPIDNPGKIAPAEVEENHEDYKVKYSDLDINGHLNSIKYIEHLLDMFDMEQFEDNQIKRLEIAYQAEGKFGMELKLYNKLISPDHNCMSIMHEGKAVCRAAVWWTK